MVLETIRNFRVGFAIILITFLIGAAAIATPNVAYSQSVSSVPNNADINTGNNNKVVILNFDDAYESQYINAKPILDKYGYKATYYIVCNYVGNSGRLTWEDITALKNEGYDIASHTMNHADLTKTSKKETEFEVGGSKQCLLDHGINTSSFAYPFNGASSEASVIDVVAKYYDIARTARSAPEPIMYLHCDGFKEESSQTDCRTYANDGEPNFANRYSIMGWSHDADRYKYSYDDSGMFNRFVEVVNSASMYNTDGTINAIPIVIWHRIDNSGEGDPQVYATTIDLFEKEIKYLHDNGFKVLTMADIGYDTNSNYLYLKR
ncbi:MAG TPA: polysaccharide deacetylase family protein [Nitrososphaeraceae archaeon]|nr:polysaccharide deacetylase family protein [Nitrososphaeraceae archaeon]